MMFRNGMTMPFIRLSHLPQWSQLKFMPTRKIYYLDPELYSLKGGPPLDSVQDFFHGTLTQLGWKTGNKEIVMDVGCGPGHVTTQLILPLFPNVEKIFAVDLLPNMIEYAKTHNSHPQIAYNVANIEDWTTVKPWKGQLSKIISILCFHWLKNQVQSFQNVHQLLQTGGEGAFLFLLHSRFFNALKSMSQDQKWNKFCKNVDFYIPESHFKKDHTPRYKESLEKLGFTILHIEEKERIDPFPSDHIYKNFFASVCVLVPHVPVERREEFKDDFFRCLLQENGRNSEGLPVHIGTMLELVIKKN